MSIKLNGLIAHATHTPFQADGQLNLEAVARLAEHLLADDVKTGLHRWHDGESHSLAVDERARSWPNAGARFPRGTELQRRRPRRL